MTTDAFVQGGKLLGERLLGTGRHGPGGPQQRIVIVNKFNRGALPAAEYILRMDQGYGRGVPPVFASGSEPVAPVTLHLADKNTLFGDFFLLQRSYASLFFSC